MVYEPTERPVENAQHPKRSRSPGALRFSTPMDKCGTAADGFTIVCTTYRLTAHYHYWTRNNPMNVQLVPEPGAFLDRLRPGISVEVCPGEAWGNQVDLDPG
jgi:anaerobic selenocysteine-containing dehydrogenase